MKSSQPDAGLWDPYWYEGSVGLLFVVDMITPDSKISSVAFQKGGGTGLDDVVVFYKTGHKRAIQVKHSRIDDSLTFGDLVSTTNSKPSLLAKCAKSWNKFHSDSSPCHAEIHTNRSWGSRETTVKRENISLLRPPLKEFIRSLLQQAVKVKSISEITFKEEWMAAWKNEWLHELSDLETEERILDFLRHFAIKANQSDLKEIHEEILSRIGTIFGVSQELGQQIAARLYSRFRVWGTSLRGQREQITREMVWTDLSIAIDRPVGNHDLPCPEPFFQSRSAIVEELSQAFLKDDSPIKFLKGSPGSGKTSVISFLFNRREPKIHLRYHAFRPITPEEPILPVDSGQTSTARSLWGDLLIQLRQLLKGRLAALKVPITIQLLDTEKIRSEVFRLAKDFAKSTGEPFLIAIDGIDHAARAGNMGDVNFLETLPAPDEVPEGVQFLLGGQPPQGYPKYPHWLRAKTKGVLVIELPPIEQHDIQQLVSSRLTEIAENHCQMIARVVQEYCKGNALSVVFAVEEAVKLRGRIEKLQKALEERQLRNGIEAYYKKIWEDLLPDQRQGFKLSKRIAACLSLTGERITGALLSKILPELDFSESAWTDHLSRLHPLIIREEGGFRIFQNDVRVSLARLTHGDDDIYRNMAGRMADYYLGCESDVVIRHAHLLNLLTIAERPTDFLPIFTPEYIIEGHAVQRPINELLHQSRQAVTALSTLNSPAWSLAHKISCTLRR